MTIPLHANPLYEAAMSRKPWEIPFRYDEPAFDPPAPAARAEPPGVREDDPFERLADRGERPERVYECHDATPIDYARGPHDDEYDCSLAGGERAGDREPLDYGRGPHGDEFGVDDDDETGE
jgi:hypothetical protein